MKTIEIKNTDETNLFQLQRNMYEELKNYITEDVNTIVTNLKIGVMLQDLSEYNITEDKYINFDTKPEPYSIGTLENINLKVDPMMNWSDTKIFLKNDDTLIDEIYIDDKNNLFI